MKPKLSTLFLTAILVMATSQANAVTDYRTGKITRISANSVELGGCMVHLNVSIGNGCPNNGWVSFNCKANPSDGNRLLASALLAASLNKQVTVWFDNAKKVEYGYCVATRIDTIF